MRGFQPSKAPAKAQKRANDGLVRGPGTGTSDDVPDEVPEGTYIMPADSTAQIGPEKLAAIGKQPKQALEQQEQGSGDGVPVQLSNGEFKLSPEQVQAIGAAVLEQIKNATHTPTGRGFNPQEAAPQDPTRSFFADGGLVEDERKKQVSPNNIYPQGSPAAGANIYGGVGLDGLGSDNQSAQSASRVAGAPGVVRSGNNYTAAPAQPAVQQQPQGFTYADNNRTVGQDIKDSWAKGNYGEAAGKTVAGTVGMFTTPIIGGASAAMDGAKGFGRGLFGMEANAAPAPATPATKSTPKLEAAGQALTATTAAPTAPTPAAPQDAATTASTTEASQATQVAPGIYRSGNSYSDSAAGAAAWDTSRSPVGLTVDQAQREGLIGQKAGYNPAFDQRLNGSGGAPTAQNLAAADALAQRSQAESLARVMANMQAQHSAQASSAKGFSPASGSNFEYLKDLRDPRTLALRNAAAGSTIFRNPAEELIANKARNTRVAGVEATINQQTRDAQQSATSLHQEAMRQQAALTQGLMRETGETGRANSRNAIESGRLGLESQVKGFDIRKGQRMEALQQQYDAAKTPEEQAKVAKRIRELSGNQENMKDNFMTVGGGQEWDANAGVMRNVPQRLVDLRTGRDVGAQAKQLPPINESPQAQAIKNNTNMSREQKAAALQQLGYN